MRFLFINVEFPISKINMINKFHQDRSIQGRINGTKGLILPICYPTPTYVDKDMLMVA